MWMEMISGPELEMASLGKGFHGWGRESRGGAVPSAPQKMNAMPKIWSRVLECVSLRRVTLEKVDTPHNGDAPPQETKS